MKLTEFVIEKAIIPDLKARTKDEAVREMVFRREEAHLETLPDGEGLG